MVKVYDSIIIGAGPSGMMAAITAAKRGKSVLVIEKNLRVGRKILATGNGRCNLTNINPDITRYHGGDKKIIKNILASFNSKKTVEYFESIGVMTKEENMGRIFPRTNQATTVVDALEHELHLAGVLVKTETEVIGIDKKENWEVKTEDGICYISKRLVLTTGGKAAHQFGSSGDGIYFAQKMGHKITPVHAALCPLEISEEWVKDIKGIKIESVIRSYSADKFLSETKGDAIFTHFGISGPAAMAQSRAVAPYIERGDAYLLIDLCPDLEEKNLDIQLEELFRLNNKKNVKNILSGILTSGLVPIVMNEANIPADKRSAEISKKERTAIIRCIKNLELTVKKVRPLKEAQVTAGGIDLSEVDSKTLESTLVPGLFFAGEILDVDGDSGGFNLQWAWSSGYVVGKSV